MLHKNIDSGRSNRFIYKIDLFRIYEAQGFCGRGNLNQLRFDIVWVIRFTKNCKSGAKSIRFCVVRRKFLSQRSNMFKLLQMMVAAASFDFLLFGYYGVWSFQVIQRWFAITPSAAERQFYK